MSRTFLNINVVLYALAKSDRRQLVALGCDTLLSEDMQHGRIIESRLTITGPFRQA